MLKQNPFLLLILKLHLTIVSSDAKRAILPQFILTEICSSCPFTSHFRNRDRLSKGGEKDVGLEEKIEKNTNGLCDCRLTTPNRKIKDVINNFNLYHYEK